MNNITITLPLWASNNQCTNVRGRPTTTEGTVAHCGQQTVDWYYDLWRGWQFWNWMRQKKKNKSMTLVFFISNDKTHFIWFVLIGCDFYGFTCATGLPLTTVWHLIDVMSTDLVAGCTCVAGWYGDTVDHPPQAPSTDTQTSESATRNKQTANKFANVNLFC